MAIEMMNIPNPGGQREHAAPTYTHPKHSQRQRHLNEAEIR